MSETQHTYVIEAVGTNLVKIGKTNDVAKRISALQIASPHRLRLIAWLVGDIERDLHEMFVANRVRGEWFTKTDELKREIARRERVPVRRRGFASWLKKQIDRDDPIGDLARDAERDDDWPPSDESKGGIESYLHYKRACSEALEAFSDAWQEWSESQ